MTDWQHNEELLLKESDRLISALLAEQEKRREPLAAIGYVYEFGRGQLCFELCANTTENAQKCPSEDRWNSGDYDYPGVADQFGGGWSDAWWEELNRLDSRANDEGKSKSVHDGIARICCNVLTRLARRGVLGDCKSLDFNVAALLDDVADVEERNRWIRQEIESNAEPGPAADGDSK